MQLRYVRLGDAELLADWTYRLDEPIGAGEAAFLHMGEDHGMTSEAGLTALIIEGGMWIGSVRVRRLIPETTAQETFPHTRTAELVLLKVGSSIHEPARKTASG